MYSLGQFVLLVQTSLTCTKTVTACNSTVKSLNGFLGLIESSLLLYGKIA